MRRRSLLAALALLAAIDCGVARAAACDDGGIGGTGVTADGGIGGTGIRPGTEIALLGAITGFGSVCVNGVEVHYDARTPVSVNGRAADARDLALGQIVAVHAVAEAGAIRARAILVADATIGRLRTADSSGTLQVDGERVRLDPGTVFGDGLGRDNLGERAGRENLRVSGLRARDGTIVATRVALARDEAGGPLGPPQLPATAPGGRFIVQGYLHRKENGEVEIGASSYRVEGDAAAGLAEDQLVRAHGRTEADGGRVIDRAEVLRRPLDARPARTAPFPRGAAKAGEPGGRADSRNRDDAREPPQDQSGRGRPDRADRPERMERPERPERVERPERPERIERPDRSGPH